MNRKLVITLLALTSLPLFAAPPATNNGGDQRADRQKQHAEMMSQAIGLREDQVTKFQAIMQSQREAHKALGRESREARKALHEETKQKLSTVLDENQVGRFEAFTEGMRMARHQQRGKGGMQQRRTTPPSE